MMAGRTDHVPKRVNPDERREAIAEAVYQVIGDRGWDAVTLRDVASTAGVSMGQVQHYFSTKTEMLLFALTQLFGAPAVAQQLALMPSSDRAKARATSRFPTPGGP